jgi:hypothetical protein
MEVGDTKVSVQTYICMFSPRHPKRNDGDFHSKYKLFQNIVTDWRFLHNGSPSARPFLGNG